MPRKVTIAGLGLIGGSIGMALRRHGWEVRYLDPAVPEEKARAAGAADEKTSQIDEDAVLVIATPVDAALPLVNAPARLVTSTCSVMEPLRHHAVNRGRFVAGHPFAGSEKSGLDAATAGLFEGKTWFVERDDTELRELVEAAGARQVVIDPAEHDTAMALTSHLPQLISTALASLIEQKGLDPAFAGSGLRTLLRLAGSAYEVWQPVLDANREHIARALDDLTRVAAQLDERDFDRARAFMAKLE